MKVLIKGGDIVNEGRVWDGYIVIEDGNIIEVRGKKEEARGQSSAFSLLPSDFDEVIDAAGCYVLPGIIDDHVHFREPGLTDKADIDSESQAAAAGGKSHVNYSFFYGATNDNTDTFAKLPADRIPGVKLFMGSSTGNMLVDKQQALERIFKTCKLPLMAHCEDTDIINRNMADVKLAWGDDPQISLHPLIRSEEACLASSRKAVDLAKKYGTRLHIAHISTAEELELFESETVTVNSVELATARITAEACVGHLYFTQLDHERLGAKIKVNPAIKTPVDQFMLREALNDGRISIVGTDHAPHLLSQKEGGCVKAASGMPMIQFSLVTMLELVDEGVLTIQRLVELMCHNPARLFGVQQRGFLRKGYRADITIVRPKHPWTVTKDCILSKCGWSPLEGHTFNWQVERTLCNGHTVYLNGQVDTSYIGQEIYFSH